MWGQKCLIQVSLEPKMDYLGVIWVILKNCCHIDIRTFELVKNARFCAKIGSLNQEIKMPLLGINRIRFEKPVVIFEINILEFV